MQDVQIARMMNVMVIIHLENDPGYETDVKEYRGLMMKGFYMTIWIKEDILYDELRDF